MPDVRCSDQGSASPLLFRFSCISLTPLSLTANQFPTLEKLRISNKTEATPKSETDLSIPTASLILYHFILNYHLASPNPERPGPIPITRVAALQYPEQAADAKEECSESWGVIFSWLTSGQGTMPPLPRSQTWTSPDVPNSGQGRLHS